MTTAAPERRACPKCKQNTDRIHCQVAGCGWWLCMAGCNLRFDRKGRAVHHDTGRKT